MVEWPFGVGDTRFVSVLLKSSHVPRSGEQISFQLRGRAQVEALDSAGLSIGEVLDEAAVLRLRHTLETNRYYLAEVSNVAPRDGQLQVTVSRPNELVSVPEPLRIIIPAKLRKKMSNRFRKFIGYEDLNTWLANEFVRRDRYLAFTREHEKVEGDNLLVLLSPMVQLRCKMREHRFLWVVDAHRLRKREKNFKTAGLIEAPEVHWHVSESDAPEATQGALTLLETIADRSEYFAIWDKYRRLELQMIEDRVAALRPLHYRQLKYYDDVVRFYLESQNDAANWSDGGTSVSVELIIARSRKLVRSDEERNQTVIQLGSVRRVTSEYVDVDRLDEEIALPPRGTLRATAIGDAVRIKRQAAALERLRSGQTPVSNLDGLLSDGVTDPLVSYPVPAFLTSPATMADGSAPNERQREAVARALNTPDICVIQGPPGTGKTAVIRTIVRRLKEEGRRHLLISSHQHTAVDNALDGMQACGVVSYRFGGNQSSAEYRNEELTAWAKQVSQVVRGNLERLNVDDPGYAQRQALLQLVEPAMALQLELDHCSALLHKIISEFSDVLGALILSRAERLLLEYNHWAQAAATEPDAAHSGRPELAKLLEQFPTGANEPVDLRALRRIAKALEQGGENGHGHLASRFNRSLKELRRLQRRVDYVDDPEMARAQLQEKLAALRDMLSQVADAITDTPSPQNGEFERQWRPQFQRWCRELVENLEEDMPTSRGNVPAVLNEWLHGIEKRPSRVRALFRKHADVWGVTCQQTAKQQFELYDEEFDCVVVDEAARTSPLDLIIPLVRARKIILVGDQMQLPHMLEYQLEREFETVAGDTNYQKLLKQSLFEQLYDKLPESKRVRLNRQYRMHPAIGRLVSDVFYHDDPLEHDDSTKTLTNDSGLFAGKSLVWHDVRPDSKSRRLESGRYINRKEVDVIANYVGRLVEEGTNYSVGVIAFYAQQRGLIERVLHDQVPGAQHVKVGTVDSFQGEQKDVIFLSMVRSNRTRAIGFLNLPNRINVALSRARRLLVLVGDSATVTASPYLKQVYEHCQQVNGVLSQV